MCIRDRLVNYEFCVFYGKAGNFAGIRSIGANAVDMNAFFNVLMFKNGNVGDGSRCLLYTSDAADERSSVDLGGSRIIKKKNT